MIKRMNILSIFAVTFALSLTCLSDLISGRPIENSSHASTSVTHDDGNSHTPHTGLEVEDSSDEDAFLDSNEYPHHYDLAYDDSDSNNISEENSNSEEIDDSQSGNNTLGPDINHRKVSQFSEVSDQSNSENDPRFQASKRNTGGAFKGHSITFQETATVRSTDDNIRDVRGTTLDPVTDDNNISSEESEEALGIRQDNGVNLPDKRENEELVAPLCLNTGRNDTATDRSGMSLEQESRRNDRMTTNQVQPCASNSDTRNQEQQEMTQNNAVSNSAPDGEDAVTSETVNSRRERVYHNAFVPVSAHVDINNSSDARGYSENTETLEESRGDISNQLKNAASNVMISEGGSNSSGSSGLNVELSGIINDPTQTGSRGNTNIPQGVPHVTDHQDVANGTLTKQNENNNHGQQLQSLHHPTTLITISSPGDVTIPALMAQLSPSMTISETTLSSSSKYVNEHPNIMATNHVTSSIYSTGIFRPHIVTTLSPSETITYTFMTTTADPLISSRPSLTYREQTHIQLTTTPLYQPAVSPFQPNDHATIPKIYVVNEDINIGAKIHPEPTNTIVPTQITSFLPASPTAAAISLHNWNNENRITAKIITETPTISTTNNLLSSSLSSASLQIVTTSVIMTAASTTVATAKTDAAGMHESITTPEPIKTDHPSDNNNSDMRPLTPGTSPVTPVSESTPGNTTSSGDGEWPSSFMELKFGMSWPDFCQNEVSIRGELVEIMQGKSQRVEITPDQLQLMSRERQNCHKDQMSEDNVISVRMYLLNNSRQFDWSLTLVCAHILKSGLSSQDKSLINNKLLAVSIHGEDLMTPNPDTTTRRNEDDDDTFSDPGVMIAVVLASVGACCCLGLIVLQVILRHRSRPLFFKGLSRSYSITSSDSIQLSSVNKSRPNSGLFNPGMDILDSLQPSNPLTFIQLTKFCMDDRLIYQEYQKIPSRMPRLSVVPAGDEDKNRYANVLPLVNTRVKLHHYGHEQRSSYINANYITGPKNQSQYYIATQAPTDNTISDFWAMVWQQGCRAIVMLTQLEEDGQVKCASYWPELVGKSAAQRHGDFQVELQQKDVHQEYIASKLKINNLREIETREIDHFWYTCWPTVGVPEPISLVKLVLDTRPKYESSNSPLVVHCSPGTGRTCTFIGLDLCMRQFEERKVVDVLRTVSIMRQERAGAIQNKEQYALVYNSLNEYATIVVSPAISAASSATTLPTLFPS